MPVGWTDLSRLAQHKKYLPYPSPLYGPGLQPPVPGTRAFENRSAGPAAVFNSPSAYPGGWCLGGSAGAHAFRQSGVPWPARWASSAFVGKVLELLLQMHCNPHVHLGECLPDAASCLWFSTLNDALFARLNVASPSARARSAHRSSIGQTADYAGNPTGARKASTSSEPAQSQQWNH